MKQKVQEILETFRPAL